MEPIPKNIEKQLNEYLFLYKEHYEKNEDKEVLFLIYDILSTKDLYNLFNLYSNDKELSEIIFSIISKRNDEDYILFFVENLNSFSEEISYHSLTYLQEKNFFKDFPETCQEFIKKNKHPKLIDIAQYIINDNMPVVENITEESEMEQKNDFVEKTSIEIQKQVKIKKSKNNEKSVTPKNIINMTNLAEVSFNIKNLTFPGKKELIFTALEKTSQIYIIRNLIYGLNTEILKESEKTTLTSLLKKLNLLDELRYDLKKINIFTPETTSSGVSFFTKVSTALTALIR